MSAREGVTNSPLAELAISAGSSAEAITPQSIAPARRECRLKDTFGSPLDA
jgi:hypothetical protein